ncbi:ABC transporter ATP-binding protein [Deinococcus yavapaiensis]|uniref:Osmoprotectant transport system ATP-binding protein n=1 Tax=Deinococcus yavapaiensis KR-236 TaxID=694435 RepID=A0A318S7X2_9DEIO|nr:ABC transporter ATP-binding protein [Deinococcus yavapaiensis]PYE51131.1 osmoprotectant transport system ATP-binding protein [Deinococcus yavapaiensis KR-236]
MIELRNVTKRYGTSPPVLENIDLHVAQGELVILIGPSGCGKSTLLRLVNRLIEPTSGTILIGGQDTASVDPVELRRGIGYVIQSIGLFPHLTIFENVEVVPSITGVSKAKRREGARELLSRVGLEPDTFGGRYPRELSGGQQQRVGIARALAADPAVLLMDEPFSAVDPLTRDALQEQFLHLKRTIGKTIVFVTHDIDEAVKLGDRVCVLGEGRVQQYDTPQVLLHRPANSFVASFVGEDRELKRLSKLTARDVMRSTSGSFERTVPATLAAHLALSKLLGADGELGVTDEHGRVIGSLQLTDFGQRA